tara:strand:- start:196 stop:378 length:183 start_codon:yes stop_codon:yes gene_type:complete
MMRHPARTFEPSPHWTLAPNTRRQFDLHATSRREINWILRVLSSESDRHGRKIMNYLVMR